MKKWMLALAMLVSFGSQAYALTVELNDGAAEDFIQRHFPDAAIPGPVVGVFRYVNRHGEEKQGYADCFVPAMGGRSEGAVSSCTVQY